MGQGGGRETLHRSRREAHELAVERFFRKRAAHPGRACVSTSAQGVIMGGDVCWPKRRLGHARMQPFLLAPSGSAPAGHRT